MTTHFLPSIIFILCIHRVAWYTAQIALFPLFSWSNTWHLQLRKAHTWIFLVVRAGLVQVVIMILPLTFLICFVLPAGVEDTLQVIFFTCMRIFVSSVLISPRNRGIFAVTRIIFHPCLIWIVFFNMIFVLFWMDEAVDAGWLMFFVDLGNGEFLRCVRFRSTGQVLVR